MQQGIPMEMINITSSLEKFQPPATSQEIIHQQPIISTEMVQQPVAVVENPVVA